MQRENLHLFLIPSPGLSVARDLLILYFLQSLQKYWNRMTLKSWISNEDRKKLYSDLAVSKSIYVNKREGSIDERNKNWAQLSELHKEIHIY